MAILFRSGRVPGSCLTLVALLLLANFGPAQSGNDFWRQQQEQQRRMDEQRRHEAEFWRRQREDQQRRDDQQRFMDNLRRQQDENQRNWQRQQDESSRRQVEESRRRQEEFWRQNQQQLEDQWRRQQRQAWEQGQKLLQQSWAKHGNERVPEAPRPKGQTSPADFNGDQLRQTEAAIKQSVQARFAAAKAALPNRVAEATEALAHKSPMAQVLQERRASDRVRLLLAQREPLPATSAAGDRMRQALQSPTAAAERLQQAAQHQLKKQ
jgi:hypothetical protein